MSAHVCAFSYDAETQATITQNSFQYCHFSYILTKDISQSSWHIHVNKWMCATKLREIFNLPLIIYIQSVLSANLMPLSWSRVVFSFKPVQMELIPTKTWGTLSSNITLHFTKQRANMFHDWRCSCYLRNMPQGLEWWKISDFWSIQ